MKELDFQKKKFNPSQLSGLEQRLSLLTSFLSKNPNNSRIDHSPSEPRFVAGQLTIVDLSDPFIDPASACGLFEIITRLFVRADVRTGKVLVVDEAHKVRWSTVVACIYSDSPPLPPPSICQPKHLQDSRAPC